MDPFVSSHRRKNEYCLSVKDGKYENWDAHNIEMSTKREFNMYYTDGVLMFSGGIIIIILTPATIEGCGGVNVTEIDLTEDEAKVGVNGLNMRGGTFLVLREILAETDKTTIKGLHIGSRDRGKL